MKRGLLLALGSAVLALAGCGGSLSSPPFASGPSSTAAVTGPLRSAEPLSASATPDAPIQSPAWWAWPPYLTTCGAPALYRIDAGQPLRLGDCATNLLSTPTRVKVRPGQEVDLHMTTDTPSGAGLASPLYPLPSSPNDAVLRDAGRSDNGATGRFIAVAPGDVVLVTTGPCLDVEAGRQTHGSCPVLAVSVTP